MLIFGVRDDFSFCGTRVRLDSKLFNDQIRRFLGDRIWVEFHREFIQEDQRYLGIALIPSKGHTIEYFKADAPDINGIKVFKKGDSAVRENDSSRILSPREAAEYSRKISIPNFGQIYCVDEPFYRILNPEYIHFVKRDRPCSSVEEALRDTRTSIISIIGMGGAGKTALATWATLKAYEDRLFNFIVSITAKDRELTSAGIQALEPALTSFESLLDNILEVLGFADIKSQKTEEKEKSVRDLLKDSKGLLFVDNLETVDDARIITFLDKLPQGTKAIVTSRRATVRFSVYPIDLGPLLEPEIIEYVKSLSEQAKFDYAKGLSETEWLKIGKSCDGIPLAIRWVLSRSKSPAEALSNAKNITSSEKSGEELLEFCFRRVFENMEDAEKAVLQVLSLFQGPVVTEALLIGSGFPSFKILDAVEGLVADALVQRLFEPDFNDYCYTLFPSARAFIYKEVSKDPKMETKIRKALTRWFEAEDVKDQNERVLIRELRQGKVSSETALLDLARVAARRGDDRSAQDLFEQAMKRNPNSWRVAKEYAEYCRGKRMTAKAIGLFEQAACYAPRRGSDRAKIYREWGMLLRDSGQLEATNLAIEKFEIALEETPNDVLTIHGLAQMLDRKGSYNKVIDLLSPLESHPNAVTRRLSLPLLLKAYQNTGNMLRAEEIRGKIRDEN